MGKQLVERLPVVTGDEDHVPSKLTVPGTMPENRMLVLMKMTVSGKVWQDITLCHSDTLLQMEAALLAQVLEGADVERTP